MKILRGRSRTLAKQDDEDASSWARFAGIGFEFIVAILMFGGAGWWIDSRFDTKPWFLLVGCGIGFAVGLWMMIRAANKTFHD